MKTKEELIHEIETWKENPILLKQYKQELAELESRDEKVKPVVVLPKVEKRIEDFKSDLLDDGKRNYSNRRKK